MSNDAPERAMQKRLERLKEAEAKRQRPPRKPAEYPSDPFGEWIRLTQEGNRNGR